MRAVYVEVPEGLIRQRRSLGIDKFDEMWEGELHMAALPSWEHQGIDRKVGRFFDDHWQALGEGVTQSHVGVKPPGTPEVEVAGECVPQTYRGPDQVFLLKGHEVIVIHRDTKGVDVYCRGEGEYERVPTSADGSVASRVLDTVFRTVVGPDGLAVLHLVRGRHPERRGTA